MRNFTPLRSVAVAASLLALAGAVRAEPAEPAFEQELWLTTGFRSHHGSARRYNERNDGIGVEWRFSPTWQINAGHYRNSMYRGSTYLQAGWMPLDLEGPAPWRLRAGASVGVVDGYPRVVRGGYFPTLVPAASLEYRRVGLNLVYIPSIGKRVAGAFALQLKARLS